MHLARTESVRPQRTIAQLVVARGIGFLTGADVTVRFLPAPEHHGVQFRRVDCPGSEPIPALIDYAVPRQRRTAIERNGVAVELTEHVLAALAGLQIDNCLVELDAVEAPGCDGSSLAFVECLKSAGIVTQAAPRTLYTVTKPLRVESADGRCEVSVRPLPRRATAITYQLDYGPRSPISPQQLTVELKTGAFERELAFARTFVLESEIAQLRQLGYGSRTTPNDLLIFGPEGIIGNSLRADDECVRHKILDCVGDFALLGGDVHGHFTAYRSGHELNREIIRQLRASLCEQPSDEHRTAA